MIKVTIDYWKLQRMAKEKPEQYEEIRPLGKKELPPLAKFLEGGCYSDFQGLTNNIEDLPDFMVEIADYEVLRPMKLLRADGMRFTNKNAGEIFASAQVHLPGNELMKILKVIVEEDCCTNSLQKLLDEGWKIIAVCPQPSRRPDYILGKT